MCQRGAACSARVAPVLTRQRRRMSSRGQMMNVEGLTRENVASHLQKFRLYTRRLNDAAGGRHGGADDGEDGGDDDDGDDGGGGASGGAP